MRAKRFISSPLTFRTLRAANLARQLVDTKYPLCKTWIRAQWMNALVGEVGELANDLKKVDRGDFTIEEILPKVSKELADIQIYLDLLAYKCGVDLAEATIEKFNIVSDRMGTDVYIVGDKWDFQRGES